MFKKTRKNLNIFKKSVIFASFYSCFVKWMWEIFEFRKG